MSEQSRVKQMFRAVGVLLDGGDIGTVPRAGLERLKAIATHELREHKLFFVDEYGSEGVALIERLRLDAYSRVVFTEVALREILPPAGFSAEDEPRGKQFDASVWVGLENVVMACHDELMRRRAA